MRIGDFGSERNRDRPRTAASSAKSMDEFEREISILSC